jgi:hypothetical protein
MPPPARFLVSMNLILCFHFREQHRAKEKEIYIKFFLNVSSSYSFWALCFLSFSVMRLLPFFTRSPRSLLHCSDRAERISTALSCALLAFAFCV